MANEENKNIFRLGKLSVDLDSFHKAMTTKDEEGKTLTKEVFIAQHAPVIEKKDGKNVVVKPGSGIDAASAWDKIQAAIKAAKLDTVKTDNKPTA